MTRTRLIGLLICALVVPAACQAHPGSLSMPTQRTEPEIFSTLAVNTEGRSACTPSKPAAAQWQGVVINAPASVEVAGAQSPVVPLCVIAVVPIVVPVPPEMIVVAVDTATGKRYSGKAFDPPPPESPDDSVPNPHQRPPRPQHEVAGMTGEVAFTTDIVAAASLPRRSGTYQVHVERGALVSNTVKVEIKVER